MTCTFPAGTPRGVAELAQAIEGEAHPTVQHDRRDSREEARHEGEGPRATLLSVDDLYAMSAQDTDERRHRRDVELGAHGHGIVGHTRRRALLRPAAAIPGRHHHVMTPPLEASCQLEELHGGAGEVVALRVQLEDSERQGHFVKKARTAATTSSISDSVWPADMGRVRICLMIRSVCSRGGGLRYSTAGC